MTLASALRALHAAGRIRSPFLVGMSWNGNLIVQADSDGTALYLLSPLHVDLGGPLLWAAREVWAVEAQPDSDPCTVGGLLALLREAVRYPGCHTEPPEDPEGRGWSVQYGKPELWDWAFGASEGQAIEAALVALAEALS